MIREKQNCQWCWKGVLQRQTMKTGEVLYRSEVVEVWCSLVFCYLYNRYLIPFSIEAYFERHLSLKKLCLPLSFSYWISILKAFLYYYRYALWWFLPWLMFIVIVLLVNYVPSVDCYTPTVHFCSSLISCPWKFITEEFWMTH